MRQENTKSVTWMGLALSLVLLGSLFYFAADRTFFLETLTSPFFSIAVLSLFFVLVRTGAKPLELLGVALLFTALAAFEFRFLGYRASWPVWVSLLGGASLGVLCLRLIWVEPSQRRFAALVLIPSTLFVVSEWYASDFLAWTERMHPKVLDLYLYSFDASLRIQFPFVMGQLFVRSAALSWGSQVAYIGLPVAIALAFAGCAMRNARTAVAACVAFLLTGPIGVVFYNLFPALGPIHVFASSFPWSPLTTEQARRLFLEGLPLSGARNAMPSLHAAWIFLVFWYARGLSGVERAAATVWVALTLCATMGTGEHYFVDLVVAVPFALLIVALTNLAIGHHRSKQLAPLVLGLGGVLAWLLALRHAPLLFWSSPAIPWLACIATVVACILGFKRIAGLEESASVGGAQPRSGQLPLESRAPTNNVPPCVVVTKSR